MDKTLAQPIFAVDCVWHEAYRKPAYQSDPSTLERWFTSNGDRYAMDFTHCGMRSNWYQLDSGQDAWYYGTWANPVDKLVLSYTEGDITLTRCKDAAEYTAEIERFKAWNDKAGYGPAGIDDHDGQHAAKLAA